MDRHEFPGVSIRPLFNDSENGDLVSLVRMRAGSHYPSHNHRRIEHCYVLEGDLGFSDHTLFAGDYEAALPGGTHSVVRSETGCLLLLINNALDELHV